MPPELELPAMPHAFARPMQLWQWLHKRRAAGGMGLGNITGPDLVAYVTLTGDQITQGDIDAIDIIDDEFHASRNENETRREKRESRKGGK